MLRRTPWYGLLKALGHYPDYWYWYLRGQPERSPHLLKQQTVRAYADKYGLRILVETGTYYGEMVSAMKRHFKRIYSIECDSRLAQLATKRFAGYANVEILQGESQRLLPELLSSLTEPALFWLDAGYYGWAGVQGDQQRLFTELEAILSHPVAGHVVLIDDARGFNGRNGAPTVDELRLHVESQSPGRSVEVQDDILRITGAP